MIVDLSIELSLEVISFCDELKAAKQYDLASQVFRSGTSIGANINEAQNAESLKDFIHKFKIAAKEADELNYWLLLCNKSEHLPNTQLQNKLEHVSKIMSKIISSSKQRAYNSDNINKVKEELVTYGVNLSAS